MYIYIYIHTYILDYDLYFFLSFIVCVYCIDLCVLLRFSAGTVRLIAFASSEGSEGEKGKARGRVEKVDPSFFVLLYDLINDCYQIISDAKWTFRFRDPDRDSREAWRLMA
jgi:hypothetical protein